MCVCVVGGGGVIVAHGVCFKAAVLKLGVGTQNGPLITFHWAAGPVRESTFQVSKSKA